MSHFRQGEERELEQKVNLLLKRYGTGPHYAEGVHVFNTVKLGRISAAHYHRGWGVCLDGEEILSFRNEWGVKVVDSKIREAIDEIDRLTVLDRIADV